MRENHANTRGCSNSATPQSMQVLSCSRVCARTGVHESYLYGAHMGEKKLLHVAYLTSASSATTGQLPTRRVPPKPIGEPQHAKEAIHTSEIHAPKEDTRGPARPEVQHQEASDTKQKEIH